MRKFKPVVVIDGQLLRRHHWLQNRYARRAARHTLARLKRRHRFYATAGQMAACGAGFAPVLHIYTSGTSATETIPGGSTVVIEGWAAGGGGGAGSGSGCGATAGGGGGAGGYSRTSQSIGAQAGKTYTYTVGASVSNGATGGTTTISAGTVTGFSTMTCNGGTGGGAGPSGVAGSGGTASGGTAANTTGANGTAGGAGTGQGATGTTGTVSGDGSPYGGGGNGHEGSGSGGTASIAGAVVFSYTP